MVLLLTATSSRFPMPAGLFTGLCCAISAVAKIKTARGIAVNFCNDVICEMKRRFMSVLRFQRPISFSRGSSILLFLSPFYFLVAMNDFGVGFSQKRYHRLRCVLYRSRPAVF